MRPKARELGKALCRDGLGEACAAHRGCFAGREGGSGHGWGSLAVTRELQTASSSCSLLLPDANG